MIIEELLTGKIEVKINPTQAMNPKLNYKSLDENIASVTSSGVITAKKAGTTTIKITAMDGSNVSSSLKVTVKDSLFDSSGYTLENARIKTGAVSTSYDSFVSKLNITEGLNITVYNDSGIKTYGNIATGDLIVKSNGSLTKKYTVIVRGDISKDGLIKSNDALLIERKVVNILDLDENQLLAADVSKDFKLATNDALLIKRYVVGLIGL